MADENPRLVRIKTLEAKLRARKGKPGYERNCEEIVVQIDNLKKAHAEELENLARASK